MLAWTLICLLLCSFGDAHGSVPAPPPGLHASIPCGECHPDGTEAVLPCLECHEDPEHIHPVRVREPSFAIPEGFPLGPEGLDCATCHRLHPPADPHALRPPSGGSGEDLRDFCLACHGEGLSKKNPHQASSGTDRCVFCHNSLDPEAVLAGERLHPRIRSERLCNFCHDRTGHDHPRNVDPGLELPDELPRGPQGEDTCITCHDPHGSSEFTHYVREAYAHHLQRINEGNPHQDDRYACRSCHQEHLPERITADFHALRYRGDVQVLCVSCHTRTRSHHPVGTPLPEAMLTRADARGGLPLDPGGRTTCITCHTNNCGTGEQRMSVRHYEARRMDLSLCWYCHLKEEFAEVNPHRKNVDETTEGCIFCHDRKPLKGLEEAGNLYFISDVMMICVRCHEDLSDSDVSHMGKVPSEEVRTHMGVVAEEREMDFPLGRDGGFTCTTCHNAHFSTQAKHKTRLPAREMCSLCHWR